MAGRLVDSTVLDHPALLLDRQLVQIFHVIRERRQYVSQLRPFRDESLDQTHRPGERWSQPVTTALLLHCVVVGLRFGLCRWKCRTRRRTRFWCLPRFAAACLSIAPVRVVDDAAQKLLGFCFLRPSTPVPSLPALARASIPRASFATAVCV